MRKIVTVSVMSLMISVFVIFIGIFLLSVEATDKLPLLGRFEMLIVQSGSMEPAVPVGGMVLINKTDDPGAIREGDVITFQTPNQEGKVTFTTHRVTGIVSAGDLPGFKTRGDANDADDSWTVPADAVRGKARFTVPYLGYFMNYLKTRTGFAALVILPALIMIFLEIGNILSGLKNGEAETGEALDA